FGKKLKEKVRFRVHLSQYEDETSELCEWNINEAHYLESWSDARGYDGTATIIQPLIAPLYDGKTAHEVVAAFITGSDGKSLDIVRDYWMRRFAAGGEEPPITAVRATNPPPAANPSQGASEPAAAPAAVPPPAPPAVDAKKFEAGWRKWLHD